MKKLTIFIIFSVLSLKGFTWDGVAVGFVKQLDVTHENNYAFRVFLKDVNGEILNQCDSHTWSYLNKSSSNYEMYVSAFLAAKMSQTKVVIYSNKETASGKGFCHIGYMSLLDN